MLNGIVQHRQAQRGAGKSLGGERGRMMLHAVAQDTVDRGIPGNGVPRDDRPPLERATSGVRLPNQALAAWKGTALSEVVAYGSAQPVELLWAMLGQLPGDKGITVQGDMKAAVAALERIENVDIGIGIGGDGRYCALVSILIGPGTGDRSGVQDSDQPMIESCWNPVDVVTLDGSVITVVVR